MNRYRIGLVALLVLVVALLGVQALRQPGSASPAGLGATNPNLIDLNSRPLAPEFTGIDGWINTAPLSISGLHGKVVLIDFWTFSCINCLRTIPHLQELNRSFGSRGLVIVGVHSPEFDFEKDAGNVAAAVRRNGVSWPVALDPEMATWNAWQNNVWPAEYLVDQQGRVAYAHLGEGEYEKTTAAVASLLSALAPSTTPAPATDDPGALTPELYAGSQRGQLADSEQYGHPDWTYPDPGPPQQSDAIQLAGSWHDAGQYVEATSNSVVRLRFRAQQIFIVAGSATGRPLNAQVRLDGGAPGPDDRGNDLTTSGVTVDSPTLYRLLQKQQPGHHLVEILVPKGFRLYTFTFG